MGSRARYYLSSVPTLLGGVRNWWVVLLLPFRMRPVIRLRGGYQFRVRSLMDVWIIKETCLDRQYERCSGLMEDGWTVIDIGAGLGDFAILVARENPGSRVYAYEPSPESYELFQENIALNGVRNVCAFPMAVGGRKGEMRLIARGEAVQHITIAGGGPENRAGNETPAIRVQGVTLDDVLETHGIKQCDFLKMDCEGCEFDVLFGASRATLGRISRICLEYHDGFTRYTRADLVRYLEQHGFRIRITPNPVHSYLGFLYAYRPG